MGRLSFKNKGKEMTLEQKNLIASQKFGKLYLNPKNWIVKKDTPEELYIINKYTYEPYYNNPIKKSRLESHCNG